MINRILVANRGEIARRVFATCRRLGIETVAVYSDADADLPFVREADRAVRLPGNSPAETYLRAELVVEVARRVDADAIHPGYGFLSENAGFARAVQDAGLTWVGPDPDSIEQMGSKIQSKKLMEAAGVPVLRNLTAETATETDLPLLVKASAGGGGRGMRVVRSLGDLPGEIRQASSEAESAFGDGTVFVETYVERGRHVEVQVVGHTGGVLVLGERDCSIQRRHQKVVEEAPAPALPEQTRAALHEAARAAAAAIDYRGAGTVEFLYDAEADRFFFLEMNTRLQVEHPVTELVHGVDLVELQLRVAEGEDLDIGASAPHGHAVEVRLYAEDPSQDYQPQSGRLTTLEIPHDGAFGPLTRYGIRLDSGFESGNEVGTFYDAMLAKLIAWGPDRPTAFRALSGALRRSRIHGLVTNRDLLEALCSDGRVVAGEVSTALLEERGHELRDPGPSLDPEVAPFVAAIALAEHDRERRTVQQRVPVAWRNVVSQPQRSAFSARGLEEPLVAEWYAGREPYRHASRDDVKVLDASSTSVVLELGGVRVAVDVMVVPETREVHLDSVALRGSLREVPRFADPSEQVAAGSLLAPMPGTVAVLAVDQGAQVTIGETLLVLEAMKMQHAIKSPADGVVDLAVQVGQQVSAGDVLAVVSTSSTVPVEEEGAPE
ncbi:MAG TPA: biotin carboxylase N-terminal domain-containing protein [Marmoricola sp.]